MSPAATQVWGWRHRDHRACLHEEPLRAFSDIVQRFAFDHRNCTPGDGDTQDVCGMLAQLLRIRAEEGWDWPVPRPVVSEAGS
ncbi:hypothetical protein OH799_11445 [Nocardia sp. NBC_00881]|uniref:hypothetical protein n=1 Tax=Nocardia sp. NBC_00881 TaxID=2975995 RepID=UPI00386E56B5|nr:hypothetical protein OH799_11445 [Nocardia sp. NBC_00881]